MLSRPLGIAAVLVVSGAFASGAGAQNPTVAAQSSDTFSPPELTVTQGQTVTFSNSGGRHNVHFAGEAALNDPSTSAWTVDKKFDTVGDFTYVCDVHESQGMTGVIHVMAAPGGPPEQEPGGGGSNPPPGSGGPAPGGQGPGGGKSAKPKVTLKASDSTPVAGRQVRLFGVVTPARDGRKLLIQKRLANGKYKTIATTRLHAAKGDKSTYSLELRVSKDTVLRARLAGSSAGLSKTRKLDVHRAA
jgi:plastocyanin